MTGKRFTVEEMQNWNKRYKLDKETAKCVIDTFDGGDYCTVHGNEAYNLCIDMNALFDENEQLKSEYEVLHTQYQDLMKFVENNFNDYLTREKLNRQIIKLSDENEQLKKGLNDDLELIGQLQKENNELKEKASSWKISASEEMMKQAEIKEENEQLKSRCNDYDKALKTLQDLTDRKLKENEELKQDSIDKKRVMAYLCKYTNWSFDEIVDDIFNNDYYDNYWGGDSYEWNWDDYVKEKEYEL